MKNWKRLIAAMLAMVLAVYGLPEIPAALAAGPENADPPMPSSKMRFVQTGFDNDTGILTMSLQIKPEAGANGESVSEGIFMFQTNYTQVVPVTRPSKNQITGETEERREMVAPGNRAAVVVTHNTLMPKAMQDYLDSNRALLISDEVFNVAMSSSNLYDRYTAYMVSSARTNSGTQTGPPMMDCYFQFYYNWGEIPPVDAEGYVTVMDFDFQCYVGVNHANSEDCLFSGSIRIPEDQQEVREMMDQFTYTDADGNTVDMTMGGAGFIQKYFNPADYNTYDGDAYYYYDEPVLSTWRKNGSSTKTKWSSKPAQQITEETKPGLWYHHINDKYVVKQLTAEVNNIVGDSEDMEGADFVVPTNQHGVATEVGRYPRYTIPTYEQSKANDTAGNWIAEAYQLPGKNPKLKYNIGTVVSTGSLTSPEAEDFNGFLSDLRWEFALEDRTPLDDCEAVEEEGEGKLIPTSGGKYYLVKEATITSPASVKGSKLWNVYDAQAPEGSARLMRCPVGVTLDMMESSIMYSDPYNHPENPDQFVTGLAPQLHIVSEAADPESYIWQSSSSGQLFLRAVYEVGGVSLSGGDNTIRLYKKERVPTESDLRTGNLVEVETGSSTAEGFWVGNEKLDGTGAEQRNDAISQGVAMNSALYDQYHVAFNDKWNTLELVPTEETQELMTELGKENPFEVVQVQKPVEGSTTGEKVWTDEYTI